MAAAAPRNDAPESISVREFLRTFADKLELTQVNPGTGQKRVIKEKSVNRPSLALTGYLKYFAHKRLQLFGAGEMGYLRDLPEDDQLTALRAIAEKNIPCMVVSRNLVPTASMVQVADEFNIPLIRTPKKSKDFSAEATVLLEEALAPRTTIHGTLLDIKGIGTIVRGKSGVGKSECALALIERGHTLVADDVIHVKVHAERELRGTCAPLSQGYMECRGLGIIDIAKLFGIRAVRLAKRIDFVVTFTEWQPGTDEERTGLEKSYFDILGHPVPHVQIPVRPGRDMAHLVEVAAMDQALKLMGHDSANEFNERLIEHMTNPERRAELDRRLLLRNIR